MVEAISTVENASLSTRKKLEGIEYADTTTERKVFKNLNLQRTPQDMSSLGEHLSQNKSMDFIDETLFTAAVRNEYGWLAKTFFWLTRKGIM